jgi:outer membrane putative beta-barrel porin/alpha-amylase
VEGGLAVPFAIKLTDKIDLGFMTEFDLRKNSAGSGYHVEYVNTAVLSYEWTEKLSTYAEVASRFGIQDPLGGIVLVGTGVLYKLNNNLQLDFGANFGLTRASDRINPFIGLSGRF